MTAILNFTLPNLKVPAGKAATPDASSPETRLEASEDATTGNQGVANKANGKAFSKLLNDRIVKKETGKEGNFDGTAQSDTETVEDNAAIPITTPRPHDPAESIENPPISNRQAIELKLSADPELIKTESTTTAAKINAFSSDAVLKPQPVNTDTESLILAGKSAITRLPGEEIALARSTARGPIQESGPATSQKPVASQALSNNPVSQAHLTAPLRSDDLPTAVSRTAERSADSQSPKGLPPAVEVEELILEQVRQQRPVTTDGAARTDRPATGSRAEVAVPSGNSEAEFAALNGKELPAGGKPLPSVLLQTPAQSAPGLSGRAEFMTRSVGNTRLRSIGREVGEVPGLERSAAANNRMPLSDVFGKVVNQVQPTASNETGMHAQSTGGDSQASGLLAQTQAGVERISGARAAAQLAVSDSNSTLSLQLQPGSQEISAQLGSRIRWMGNLNISSAELKLYPAELGTLEIFITAEDDQARVNFITSTTAAKEMIEASLPRLRELLGQSGMFLEQGDVTHRDLSKNNSDSAKPVVEGPAVESLHTEALEQVMPMYQRSASDHRIDHFA